MNDEDLQDFFAALAMLGLLAGKETRKIPHQELALQAYNIAEELQQERNTRTTRHGIDSITKTPGQIKPPPRKKQVE